MSLSRIVRLAFFLLVFTAPAVVLHAQAPKTQPIADPNSLVGQLLVATPDMGGTGFEHAVILMIHHGPDGALGVVINRPVAMHPIAEIMEWIGQKHDGVKGQVRIFAGGPVEERVGFILHSADYHRPETMTVGPGVEVTSTPGILRDMGMGKGPTKALVAFGYAGWTAKQLEAEIDQNDWVTTPIDPKLIFDTASDQIWDKAWARHTVSL
jgi:putative transcriptional regulator